jgi:hypothetical protein
MIREYSDAAQEERWGDALAACLEAAEHGADRQALLAGYPEFAADLAEFLDRRERVERLAAPLREIVAGSPAAPDILACTLAESVPLGDFRIIRKVGRGGMGVVYEAEQVSLGRRVALKVLSLAATMDPQQLQRFQNEARAAASLEHPHIVPVYGVGCERGVHYYAMKFIDGQSLAQVIAGLRGVARPESSKGVLDPKPTPFEDSGRATQPNVLPLEGRSSNSTAPIAGLPTGNATKDPVFFRRVAELGVQAAEALEYAHSMGIVHRDVKPGNLMLDGGGKL